jgi:hypothetical protein
VHLTRRTAEGFKMCCGPLQWMELEMICCGMTACGDVRSECEDDEGADCADGDSDTVALCIKCAWLRIGTCGGYL